MGELRTQDKRDKLRLLFESAKTSGKTLSGVLMEALQACDAAVSNGAFLAGTGEAGGSVSFMVLQDFSPVVARRLIGELFDCHDQAVGDLDEGVDAKSAAGQISIRDGMLALLQPIRRYHNDFTGLRFGTGLTSGIT